MSNRETPGSARPGSDAPERAAPGAGARGRPAQPAPEADADFRIARDGSWHYRGSPIGRPALVRLFSTILRREADGGYWLVTPVERSRVAVEDAPFLAVDCNAAGEGEACRLTFRTNVGDSVTADAEHPIRVALREGRPRPYVLVREGLEALIARSVYYRLVDWAEPDPAAGALGVWSGGVFFPLGPPHGD